MTVGMAFVQECVCGYKKRDPSNWSKHRKACRALRVIEPLQRENERLRTLQQDATERAVQALQEQYSKLAAKVKGRERSVRAFQNLCYKLSKQRYKYNKFRVISY